MPTKLIELQDLLNAIFNYPATHWDDEVDDKEGDNSKDATPFAAILANNFENGIKLSHERLNDVVIFTEASDRIQKDMRFQLLLYQASMASGLTTNILVDNFQDLSGINLIAGAHDPELRRIYLP